MSTTGESKTGPTPAAPSLTALQCELRQLFASRPTNRALAGALERIGAGLGAIYVVVHTRLGVHMLSEEWTAAGEQVSAEARERINQALWESVSSEESRLTHFRADERQFGLVTVVMYDAGVEPSGGAAIVLRDCDRQRALQVVAQLEGLLGYVSLLLDNANNTGRRTAERQRVEPSQAAEHPTQLAKAILGDLEVRYGLELTAIGFTQGDRVEVVAISGVEQIRASNPGITQLRDAMNECLDRREAIVHTGRDDADDCRLHAQWSSAANGRPVATFPLLCLGRVVAVVAMVEGAGTRLDQQQVQLIAEELSGYAALVPLSRAANRSLLRHALDSARETIRSSFRRGRRRFVTMATLGAAALAWFCFGTMDYTFTAPCTVKASDRRTISCPRSGVLAELFVRPGERVRQGQILAAIDASEDILRRAELSAEIDSMTALIDLAVATRQSGQVRVHEARRRSLMAQLAIVDAAIAQAQIRAPQDGMILNGDLRDRLGSRLELGTPLFDLARHDRAVVEVRIPEKLVLTARDAVGAEFAPTSQPGRTHALVDLRIAPASTIADDRNVFLGEAEVAIDLALLPPGMEGTVRIDAGSRPVYWVLTHRMTDWLHLNFWL